MGGKLSSKLKYENHDDGIVGFNSFDILRSIGRGSFGKVCIAQKKDTNELFAMKYVNKRQCIAEGAVNNIFREIAIMKKLENRFIVNLRYAFHDVEDMCIVVDLLLGGDLRYHLTKLGSFSEQDLKIYLLEIASALDYLREKRVIHRDIKPDNLLLCEEGHVHLTDFNVASLLIDRELSTTECGTHQYMAPEIFLVSIGRLAGYSFEADWWSLGVTIYELARGKRPFDVPKTAPAVCAYFESIQLRYSRNMSSQFIHILQQLLTVDHVRRLSNSDRLERLITGMTMQDIITGKIKPGFKPSSKKLHVDPSHELEEMIIESHPLHKKQERLSKNHLSEVTELQCSKVAKALKFIDDNFSTFDYNKKSRPEPDIGRTSTVESLSVADVVPSVPAL